MKLPIIITKSERETCGRYEAHVDTVSLTDTLIALYAKITEHMEEGDNQLTLDFDSDVALFMLERLNARGFTYSGITDGSNPKSRITIHLPKKEELTFRLTAVEGVKMRFMQANDWERQRAEPLRALYHKIAARMLDIHAPQNVLLLSTGDEKMDREILRILAEDEYDLDFHPGDACWTVSWKTAADYVTKLIG
ncbi:MAG: hypothetical protein ABW007_19165 [Chitinophagaceae bacterium]